MIPVGFVMLLAKVTVVLGAALLLARALRGASAGTRHLVWLVALTAALSIPLIGLVAPLRLELLPASFGASGTAEAAVATTAVAGVDAPISSFGAPTQVTAPTAIPSVPPTRPPSLESLGSSLLERSGLNTGTALLLVWLGGALAITAWLAQGWFAVHRIVRRARVVADGDWLDPLYEVADRLGLDESPRLVKSDEVRMPFACGLVTPTIVLPTDSEGWSSDRRRAVLMHELAHIRRRDLIGHTLSRFVCAIYWFHPLVWLAARRLRSESEHACDDLVVGSGARPADYAEHLLDIVTSVRSDSTPNLAVAMARRSEFEGRMLAILDPARPRRAASRRQAGLVISALGALTVLLGAAVPADAPSGGTAARQSTDRGVDVGDDRGLVQGVTVSAGDTGSSRLGSPMPRPISTPLPIADPADPEDPAASAQVDERTQRSIERSAELSAERAARIGARVAAEMVGGKQPADATPRGERVVLLTRLARSDSSASVRRVAVWGLEDFVEEYAAARSTLVAVIRDDRDAKTREMAAWALSEADGSDEAAEALSAVLRRDEQAPVRATAAWALGRIKAASASSALNAALADSDQRVRIRAAWSLGTIALRSAPPGLLALLKDPSAEARRVATWAIRRSADAGAIPALRAAMKVESNDQLRVAYLRTLSVLGANSTEAIQGLLDSGDPQLREEAIRLLAGARRPDPWPWPWPDPRPFP
jgi:beta-lactamase regulating signal transducer with metallopeptidase domain